MAEGKKAFIVYTDWIKYTNEMTYEQEGKWIDWCLNYCNDTNPDFPDDPMAKMLCIMCKDILKRDLKKYENKVISIQNAREKRKCNIENNNEINIENNIATSGVNSNKLIVNSNKLIVDDISSSNNIEDEELQIEIIKSFMMQLEELLGKVDNPKNRDIAINMCKTYGSKTALNEIKRNIDKKNPIGYANTILQNQNKETENYNSKTEKKILRKSQWGKEFKEELKREKEQDL